MSAGCCDIAAIERARGGDQHAFAHLYRQHSRRVLSLCRRMTRDASTAEDCMQEAFFNAWRALHRYETRAAFTSWLHRIAVNVVLAKQRKHAIRVDSTIEIEELEESEWSVDTPLEEREIENAIEALPEGARNVLMLSAIGYSHPETAHAGACRGHLQSTASPSSAAASRPARATGCVNCCARAQAPMAGKTGATNPQRERSNQKRPAGVISHGSCHPRLEGPAARPSDADR